MNPLNIFLLVGFCVLVAAVARPLQSWLFAQPFTAEINKQPVLRAACTGFFRAGFYTIVFALVGLGVHWLSFLFLGLVLSLLDYGFARAQQ